MVHFAVIKQSNNYVCGQMRYVAHETKNYLGPSEEYKHTTTEGGVAMERHIGTTVNSHSCTRGDLSSVARGFYDQPPLDLLLPLPFHECVSR
jgi:hypothetical protein